MTSRYSSYESSNAYLKKGSKFYTWYFHPRRVDHHGPQRLLSPRLKCPGLKLIMTQAHCAFCLMHTHRFTKWQVYKLMHKKNWSATSPISSSRPEGHTHSLPNKFSNSYSSFQSVPDSTHILKSNRLALCRQQSFPSSFWGTCTLTFIAGRSSGAQDLYRYSPH